MAKNSKKSKTAATNRITSAQPNGEAESSDRPAISEMSVGSKTPLAKAVTRAKSKPKRPGDCTRKAAGEKPRKAEARKKNAPAEATLSDDQIRLRAYFISEQRMRKGIAGDSGDDWLEARRQLEEEARARA